MRYLLVSLALHAALGVSLTWQVYATRRYVTVPLELAVGPITSVPTRRKHSVVAKSPSQTSPTTAPDLKETSVPHASNVTGSELAVGPGFAEFRVQLWSAIESRKEYPALARARHQMGRVLVAFTLKKDGLITDVRVAEPCAYPLLNRAALDTLEGMGRFRPIPDTVSTGDLSFTVPLNFRIGNG